MSYEEKTYLKIYLKIYLIYVGILVVIGAIGVTFFNQEVWGLLWMFAFVSIGLLISFFIKRRSLKKEK